MVPNHCWFQGHQYECGLSLSCVFAGSKPLDLCNGGITGWSISILYTLYDWYDNNNIYTKKIVVGICSVHRDISSKTNNFKIFKFLLSKKLILESGSILAQNSTYNFEGV